MCFILQECNIAALRVLTASIEPNIYSGPTE